MKHYSLTLQTPIATSFRCVKAANSLDIDAKKKSIHAFAVDADIQTSFNIGLIVGASGSGKTTFAKSIWGENVFEPALDLAKPVIDQFPNAWSYDECAGALAGVGLTSVPCWIRPAYTLSNGQRARAECALQMARAGESGDVVIDEWTSVVDRTVAKVMSHCVAKFARKTNKRIVLCSCHYDVIDWLNPDWIIDCNKQSYIERRSLWQSFKRDERLQFDIRPVPRSTWRYFSKYHYLSELLPGGHIWTFGVFHGVDQIGFLCFANYVPHRDKQKPMQVHANRMVIHPDYAGFGLSIRVLCEASEIMAARGFDVRSKFSSTPIYLSMKKQPQWLLVSVDRNTKTQVGNIGRGAGLAKTGAGFRRDVKTYSFVFLPDNLTSKK